MIRTQHPGMSNPTHKNPYEVRSASGLEGVYANEGDAEFYADELRRSGVRGVVVERRVRQYGAARVNPSRDIVATVTNDRGIPFNVRVVRQGDRYGLNDKLVHDKPDPLIEFYDARYQDDPRFSPGLGQFVARYYYRTLTGQDGYGSDLRQGRQGLSLHGGIANWTLTAANARDAMRAVEDELLMKQNGTARANPPYSTAAALTRDLQAMPAYNGWTVAWEYPGYLAFHRSGSPSVLATPDYYERGKIAVEVVHADGSSVAAGDIAWPLKGRTPESYMAVMRPVLDSIDERRDEGGERGGMARRNPAGLTAKGERMYEHIKRGYEERGEPRAAEIASRTVLSTARRTPGLKRR